MGVGAWACKGDPQSSLDRGTTTAVISDPQAIFVDNGSTVQVLVEARDNLNQATEITSVTSSFGSGITVVRDFLFQPVFDASATDAASCAAIANSSWTGAGCLVPRTNPTRIRYEVTGNVAGATSFQVTVNGMALSIPVTVTPLAVTVTVSSTLPVAGQGLGIQRLTTGPPFSFSQTAMVTSVIDAGSPANYMNVGVAPDGSYIEYVQLGATTALPTISGVLFIGIEFELPADQTVMASPSTLTGCDVEPGPPIALPTTAATTWVWWDDGCGYGGSDLGLPSDVYSFISTNASNVFDYSLTWNPDPAWHADLGTWFLDLAATVSYCTADGAGGQDGGPESASCVLPITPGFMAVGTFDETIAPVQHTFTTP